MDDNKVALRSNCRFCGAERLDRVLHFDRVPFFDQILESHERGTEFVYPMDLYLCATCQCVQTQHDVNIQMYYKNYEYIASASPFVRKYMEALVDYCFAAKFLRPGDRVIEIGAADGHLLSLFSQRGATVLGFEAAENLTSAALSAGVNVVNALFDHSSVKRLPLEFSNAELIVLLHTFDHLYDPAEFLLLVSKVLNPDRGILLLEVHDFQDIYNKFETSLFGHEHASYLHYGSMARIMEANGFRIVDFNFLPKSMLRGSSMLVAVTPKQSTIESQAKDEIWTADRSLDDISALQRFQNAVDESFQSLKSHIREGRAQGKRFAGYGGWGRGVTTMAMAGLGSDDLEFVVDGNASLHGRYTPVSDLVIRAPEYVDRTVVDEIVVFNYAYIDEIRGALQGFIDNGGTVSSVLDFLKPKL